MNNGNNLNLHWYQWENIEKLVYRVMNMNFSDLVEVRRLRQKLREEISSNINFHMQLHRRLEDYHDCKEFESRTAFGRKLLQILDETIRELENKV